MTAPDQSLLTTAILRTMAYFDVLDYPLTATEVWRWLYRGPQETWNVTPEEVRATLNTLVANQRLGHDRDWYTLPGREAIVAVRAERLVRNEKKWKRAKSTARFLEVIPYVKLAAVVNTLAIDNARAESDIDFLIVTEPERIWIARLMVTGIVEMLGYRRHGEKIADRICLSFYLTTKGLNLSPLKLDADDPHFAFWASQAVPLMDEATYEQFLTANRELTARLPNAWTWSWQNRLLKNNGLLRGIKRFYGRMFGMAAGNFLEAWARDYQLQRMDKNVHSKAKLGTTEVVISEDVLKFHEDDRRAKYNAAYRQRCEQLGIAP